QSFKSNLVMRQIPNGCWDGAMGMMFLSQTTVRILGNFSLIYHYLFFSITGCRLRSTDLIIKHLIVANTLFLLPRGVPQTMAAFGFRHFLNYSGCKFLFYVHRVGLLVLCWPAGVTVSFCTS
uniref:Vomeronasal type-1 receptor n=1 Tax=Theropithecus gelada TaxID=9565 RepID=A0A8D2JX27_THEGE